MLYRYQILFICFLLSVSHANDQENKTFFPLKPNVEYFYFPIFISGKLLVDPDEPNLYWTKKYGFTRETKMRYMTLSYPDTCTIAGHTFYIPRIENDFMFPEISYILNSTIGQVENNIYMGTKGIGCDRLERLFDVTVNPPPRLMHEVKYFYYNNIASVFSRVFNSFFWAIKKIFGKLVFPTVEVYDNYTLVTSNKTYKECRVFIFPNSFYIISRGIGIVAFGHNTNKDSYYYLLDKKIDRVREGNRPRRKQHPRRKRK
ncbi:MAG: hypothetical protein ABIA63_08735 [bacterium]